VKNRAIRYGLLSMMVLILSLPASHMKAFGQAGFTAGMDRTEFAEERIKKLQQVSRTLRELAGQPLPAKLSSDEKKNAEQHTKWLDDSSQKLNELAYRWQSSLSAIERNKDQISAQKQLMEMSQSFNLQYLDLQKQMQDESRRFTLISNIMKNKHDTAKNSINNLR